MTQSPTNWRLLEVEIIAILERQGLRIENDNGELWLEEAPLCITEFAQALAERVSLNTQAAQVREETP